MVCTVHTSAGVDFGLETFLCHMKDVVMFTLSEHRVEADRRRVAVGSSTAVFAECVCATVYVGGVVGVGPLLWQSPGQTAGCSPCGGAQGSLSQQDLVTSKD